MSVLDDVNIIIPLKELSVSKAEYGAGSASIPYEEGRPRYVRITDINDDGTFTYGNQEIINTTGAVLPSTGGIGTTLFITIGSLMTVVAGIVLITKFRLSKEHA